MNFETVKSGSYAGELVRLQIPATNIVTKPLPHHITGRAYTATGYGSKIPTMHMVKTIDSRWRRVYCAGFSNVGTLYVMHGKEKTIVKLPYGY